MKPSNGIYLSLLVVCAISVVGCSRSSFNVQKPFDSLSGIPSEKTSTISVSENNVADGITAAVVSVNIKDVNGLPVKEFSIHFSVTGSQNVILPCSKTDASGVSRCLVYSTQSEMKLIKVVSPVSFTVETMFHPPRPDRSGASIVSAGSSETLISGHKIVTTAGISESVNRLTDSSGVQRVQTSIQAILNLD